MSHDESKVKRGKTTPKGTGGSFAGHDNTIPELTLTDAESQRLNEIATHLSPDTREFLGSPERFRALTLNVLGQTAGGDVTDTSVTPHEVARRLRDAHVYSARNNIKAITREDGAWPTRLERLGADAPAALWTRGNDSLLNGPVVAMDGARAATGYGEHVAMEAANAVANDDTVVMTGGAYGIGAMATRATLAARGKAAIYLASGVDVLYPAGNSGLLERVIVEGVLVAEAPPSASPTKQSSLRAAQVRAALSDAVVIVEAGWRSGSLNTASNAKALGVPVGAFPGPITSQASQGCHDLIARGDARLLMDANSIADLRP